MQGGEQQLPAWKSRSAESTRFRNELEGQIWATERVCTDAGIGFELMKRPRLHPRFVVDVSFVSLVNCKSGIWALKIRRGSTTAIAENARDKDVGMKHCMCAALVLSLAFGQTMVTRAKVLIDQMPAAANISSAELDLIATLLENSADDWQRERAPGLRFKRVALSGAKLDAVFVRSTSAQDCGATGNCPVWLLRQRAGAFELLLSDFADDVNLADQRSKGWRNIVLASNRSAESSELRVFVFDDHAYVKATCYEESSSAGHVSSHKISCK